MFAGQRPQQAMIQLVQEYRWCVNLQRGAGATHRGMLSRRSVVMTAGTVTCSVS